MVQSKTKQMTLAAFGAILIGICSWISVPAVVPFTLQTFAIFCVLCLLGGKWGTTSILLYLLIGLAGLPVFSGMQAGPGILFGPTGGYLIGFLMTGLVFWLMEKLAWKKKLRVILSLILGLLVCYAFGTMWFMLLYARTGKAIGLGTALSWCVIPFLLPDGVKLLLGVLISERVAKAVN